MASIFTRKSKSAGGVEAGICKGDQAGRLGLWASFKAEQGHEVFRTIVNVTSPELASTHSFSYTFLPAYDRSFVRFVELPLEFKEFLVGLQRATVGKIEFEFWCESDLTIPVTLDLEELMRVYRGHGKPAPSASTPVGRYQEPDKKDLASIPRGDLKAQSEKVKAELAEKRRQEEEARKAKEAADKAAAEAAAKAAADKAKAAAAKPAAKTAEGGAPAPSGPTLQPAKVGIFYGSSTGNTEDVANQLKAALGDVVDYCKNVTDIVPQDLTMVETLIVGVPTWHIGEMQDDWAAILPDVANLNYANKKIAVFGLGDFKGYPETYVDAMHELVEKFEKTGAKLYGMWPTEGYDFTKSKAVRDGKFLGLVIDIENQNEMTEKRVKTWAAQLKKELGI